MTDKRIYLSPPTLVGDELERFKGVLESGWIAPLGPELDGFENDLSERVGGAHVVGLSSGTAALHIALKILGISEGDDVWVSSMTFVASANAIAYANARPIFLDSDKESWCMNPELLDLELKRAASQNKLPKAIMPVDLYGQPASYDRILKSAAHYDIPVVCDAAESLGAQYKDKPVGSFGRFSAFSFNGNKIITTSGGGALVCQRKEDADKARYLSTQARLPFPYYQHEEIGFNYRLSNILAALGRSQLKALDGFINKRKENKGRYQEGLKDVSAISFMPAPKDRSSNHWLTCIQIDPAQTQVTPEDIRLALEDKNIESRPLWKPMHMQPLFKDAISLGGCTSEEIYQKGLCLPSGSSLKNEEIDLICQIISNKIA